MDKRNEQRYIWSDNDDSAPGIQDQPEYRNLTLCKFCCSALSRGRYAVRRIDTCRLRVVKSCDLCHTRTRCGEYEVSVERHEKVERVKQRNEQSKTER